MFHGDETPVETLTALGVDPNMIPNAIAKGAIYDADRLAFGPRLGSAWRLSRCSTGEPAGIARIRHAR